MAGFLGVTETGMSRRMSSGPALISSFPGLAWYQGDIETNQYGVGHERFIGRFSIETFIVAQEPPAPRSARVQ
jgi:hypothetical protein